jgi:hypothetical protein
MWNMKCFVIPVIIGATGIVSKSLQKYLETTPGQHSIDSLQKTAILGTSRIIRKVLQAEIEARVVGITIGSKREVPGKRKPVIREQQNNNNNRKKRKSNKKEK